MINETHDPSRFIVTLRSLSDCMFEPYPAWSYKLFDRRGLVDFRLVPADPRARESTYDVPIRGEPPFLFVGDGYACRSIRNSEASGISSGYELDLAKGFDMNDSFRPIATENITLLPGQKKVSVPWAPGPLVWDLEGGVVEVESARGFVGAIRVFYPDGSLWGEKRYGSGGPSGFQPLHYQPGNYTIEAEADVAAASPLTFRYVFASMSLDARVCTYGFQWAVCEDSDGQGNE